VDTKLGAEGPVDGPRLATLTLSCLARLWKSYKASKISLADLEPHHFGAIELQ